MLFSTILLSTAGKELGLEEELGYFSRHPSQITFFCGHDPECLVFGSPKAAQQAKQNVEKYYAVVAILEEMKKSMYVFEQYIPKMFNNASKIYEEIMSKNDVKMINKMYIKPHVQSKTLEMLKQNFSLEIDFYNFCKSRLHKQYLIL